MCCSCYAGINLGKSPRVSVAHCSKVDKETQRQRKRRNDGRELYTFNSYHHHDYLEFLKPGYQEKTLYFPGMGNLTTYRKKSLRFACRSHNKPIIQAPVETVAPASTIGKQLPLSLAYGNKLSIEQAIYFSALVLLCCKPPCLLTTHRTSQDTSE